MQDLSSCRSNKERDRMEWEWTWRRVGPESPTRVTSCRNPKQEKTREICSKTETKNTENQRTQKSQELAEGRQAVFRGTKPRPGWLSSRMLEKSRSTASPFGSEGSISSPSGNTTDEESRECLLPADVSYWSGSKERVRQQEKEQAQRRDQKE